MTVHMAQLVDIKRDATHGENRSERGHATVVTIRAAHLSLFGLKVPDCLLASRPMRLPRNNTIGSNRLR